VRPFWPEIIWHMASKGKGKVQPGDEHRYGEEVVQGGAASGGCWEGDRVSGAKELLHCLSALGTEERPTGLRVVVLWRYTFNRLSTAAVARAICWRLATQRWQSICAGALSMSGAQP